MATETIPKEVRVGIARIKKLDVKEREFQKTADQILSTSAVGQAPPVYGRTLDKAIDISQRKAKIWNTIRGFGIPGTGKTLWQLAIANRLPTVNYGQEQHLDFYADDIEKMIPKPPAEAKEPWKMTQKEYLTMREQGLVGSKAQKPELYYGNLKGEESRRLWIATMGKYHKENVEKALSEGKPVPPEVLKDYPELTKREERGGKTKAISRGISSPRLKSPTSRVNMEEIIPIHNTGYATRGEIKRGDVPKLLPHPDLHGMSTEVQKEVKRLERHGEVIRYDDYTFPLVKKGYAMRQHNIPLEEQKKKEAIRTLKHGSWKAVPDIQKRQLMRLRGKFQSVPSTDLANDLAGKVQENRPARAVIVDNALLAKQVVPVQFVNLWAKHPNRYDIKGVDTPSNHRIVPGVAYADKGQKRLARRHHRGWKRIKL